MPHTGHHDIPSELITAPEPFLSTYDGPVLTGLARGGLLDSLVWPSWWCTGLQGREELRMWASLSGSGDSKEEVLGQGSKASALWGQSKRTWQHIPPGIMPASPFHPLCPSNTLGQSYPVYFQLRLQTRQGCGSESPESLTL